LTDAMLLDNSAWSRLAHPSLPVGRRKQIATALQEGRLVVSLPFLLEAGYSARDADDHAQLLDELGALPRVAIDEEVESRALDAQGRLARTGHHRIPPVDLTIAALADHHGLGVLHYDGDFELILERTNLRFESVWLAERGSL
jgi:predicted nucleic acid-binding protein